MKDIEDQTRVEIGDKRMGEGGGGAWEGREMEKRRKRRRIRGKGGETI